MVRERRKEWSLENFPQVQFNILTCLWSHFNQTSRSFYAFLDLWKRPLAVGKLNSQRVYPPVNQHGWKIVHFIQKMHLQMVQFPASYVSLPECNSIFLHPQTSLHLDFFVGPPFCYWSKLLTRLWRTWDLLFSATLSKNKPGDNNCSSLPPISQQIKSLEKSWNMWHILRVKIEGFCSKKTPFLKKTNDGKNIHYDNQLH